MTLHETAHAFLSSVRDHKRTSLSCEKRKQVIDYWADKQETLGKMTDMMTAERGD